MRIRYKGTREVERSSDSEAARRRGVIAAQTFEPRCFRNACAGHPDAHLRMILDGKNSCLHNVLDGSRCSVG